VRIPIEPETEVSEELSEVLAAAIESARDDAVTLGLARDSLERKLAAGGRKPDGGFGTEQTVYAELARLIEQFGEDAAAADFVSAKASEELSELIEALVDQADEEQGVTLADIREAISHGEAASLEGRGTLDAEDEQAVLAELDRLIERYGADALAEELLRFD
jgi:hypothetical protein